MAGGGVTFSILFLSGVCDFSGDASVTKELTKRMESIPVESICSSIVSGHQIAGDDHIAVWNNGKRYIVGGWRVAKNGVPVFYWTGADLPTDEPACKAALGR